MLHKSHWKLQKTDIVNIQNKEIHVWRYTFLMASCKVREEKLILRGKKSNQIFELHKHFQIWQKTFKIQHAGNHSNMVTAIVFKYCIIFISYLFQKRVCLVMQGRCYWSCCTNENDVACLLATQFVKNEGADQTQIETYFDK